VGSLVLIFCMALGNVILFMIGRVKATANIKLTTLGFRNNIRRRVRSLALVGLLASGLFIVFTVGANRHGTLRDAHRRESGTGGFAFYAESSTPILYDLISEKGQRFYGLDRENFENVKIVQMRVKDGDDASCLNLNRVTNPRLFGIDPEEFANRGSFTFAKLADEVDRANPWMALNTINSEDVIPAFADQTVIVWGLGKSVGDTLVYRDERGDEFKLRLLGGLANSIFQGNILISEQAFIQKYPSISGYRVFLIDVSSEQMEKVEKSLSWSLQDFGLDLIPTSTRLAEFNKVENTYLSIFLILGGLGIILGSVGVGIVLMRNVLERRGEMALLRAVGFSRSSLHVLLLSEHIPLVLAGVVFGVIAAVIAVLPALLSPGVKIPYVIIALIFLVMVISGMLWTYLATFIALRRELLPALRNE
jgi:putative ABC transport system permease protein